MAAKPKSMSKVKQILQLRKQGRSIKEIVRITGISRNTVRKYLALADQSEKSLSELVQADEKQLEEELSGEPTSGKDERYIDFLERYDYLVKELKRHGVSRYLLWSEYKQSYAQGYGYTQFCWHLRQIAKQRNISAVINHQAGDLLYIDFAGKTMEYVDRHSGEVIKVQVLVAVLGYSQYSYVEAVGSQKVGDLIGALVRALAFFQGAPRGIVPDNLKSAVVKADRYEPGINRVLEDFANHYATAIIPTRVASPQDKSLAENGVQHAYRKIYAPLRNQCFFSLEELNQAISPQLDLYNRGLLQGRDYSRHELFVSQERAELAPLSALPFEIKRRRKVQVQKNSHVYLGQDQHYYSVPHQWIGFKAMIIYTPKKVSIYVGTNLVASHLRDFAPYKYTTVKEHLPSHLQHYHDRSPAYYLERANKIDVEVGRFIQGILESKRHPEQAYKSCDGVLAIGRKVGSPTLIKACEIANEIGHYGYGFIKRIINSGMASPSDESPETKLRALPRHDNIRGKLNYQ